MRSRLGEYYANEGSNDPVLLEIPKGHYQVFFEQGHELRPGPGKSRRRLWLASVAALALATIGSIWTLVSTPDPSGSLPTELPIPIVIAAPTVTGVELRQAELLADEILRRLAKVAIFNVSPAVRRGSSQPGGFRLEPSMQALDEERIEVSVGLSRHPDGQRLWTGSSIWLTAGDRDGRRNVVEQVARAMKALLDPRDLEYLGDARSMNRDALRAFLMGRVEVSNRTPAAYERALAHFNAALRLDSHFAMAYLGKAVAYGLLSTHRPVPENAAAELFAKAKALAPELPSVLVMEAGIERMKGNFERSDQLVSQVVERFPNYREVGFADLLAQCGRVEAALRMTNAILDDDSDAIWALYLKAKFLWVLRRNEEALAVTDQILSISPGDGLALLERSRILRSMGRSAESVASLPAGFESLSNEYDEGGLDGLRVAQLGVAQAIERGDRIESPEQAWRYYVVAYAALGESEQAVEWLAEGHRLNRHEFLWFRQYPYPGMSEVRRHPAFAELMERTIGSTSRCPAALSATTTRTM